MSNIKEKIVPYEKLIITKSFYFNDNTYILVAINEG
jgi:hypothetical protein